MNALLTETFRAALAPHPTEKTIRILEIGAGSGGATTALLPCLAGRACLYDYTDISPYFLRMGRKQFSAFPFVNYRLFDIDKPFLDQGFTAGSYDIVLAANVLHAGADIHAGLLNAAGLLVSGGEIMLLEQVESVPWLELIFGLTEGWWRAKDRDLRPSSALISSIQWIEQMRLAGFDNLSSYAGEDAHGDIQATKAAVMIGRRAK
jgi:SAM-dependent methyltransferase